ncbi:hypothetical protein PG993_013731 [Apiospora rasikravindrae]|uniref:Uncharacterized protein n=1 Tax=Apiospora rasikravindrae TaxID=990691 RepID=A0ABR1RSI9_9PEZI
MKSSTIVTVASACLLQTAAATAPKGCCRSNQCLKAIGSPRNNGVADCSANLRVTVTVSPSSAVTTTETATQTGTDTALFTETVTETASTETLLFTTDATVTAATHTNTVAETVTVPATSTDLTTAPAATTTSFVYPDDDIFTLKRRLATVTSLAASAASALPDYLSAVCPSWDKYTSACRCAGVEPVTVTAVLGAAPTVTVTASTTVVGSTLSSTDVETASATATTEVTLTETVTETPTPSTTTQVNTATSTVLTQATETPSAIVVPRDCQATGNVFRGKTNSLSSPSGDAQYMFENSNMISFHEGSSMTAGQLQRGQWVLDSRGYLQLATPLPGAGQVLAAYVDGDSARGADDTVEILMKPVGEVNFLADAIGAVAHVQGCISPTTGEITLRETIAARSNILLCGLEMVLSRGDGRDILPDGCTPITMTAV